mgnify:CR=1 FL=1
MNEISIDLETFSSTNLATSGVYRYTEDPAFQVLLFGFSVDGSEPQVVDLAAGEKIPAEIIIALSDPSVTKWAFNALFERTCLSRHLGIYLSPEGWRCSMVWAATLGLPLSLEGVGAVLGLEKQKLQEGKELIKFFCVPCNPTVANKGRTRNLPCHAPDKWEAFKQYNLRDVEVELAIKQRMAPFPVPEEEWQNYWLDQRINDTGIALDMTLVQAALRCHEQFREHALQRAREITGLDNPNSPIQLLDWMNAHGVTMETMTKEEVGEKAKTTTGEVQEALQLRLELAKSSVKKYEAMKNVAGKDGRARGLIQYYGANRTGRFAGRLIQVQNLPQNHLPDLEEARELVRSENFDALEMLYDSPSDVLKQLIRTAFVPKPGCRFIVADYSAIEARVIAWLAGEIWRQDVFAKNGDIYCASASAMFHVPVVKHGVNGHLRQKGKIAELALGYAGSTGALKSMGALNMGLTEDELPGIVQKWRQASPHIVRFWWDVDRATKQCVITHEPQQVGRVRFAYEKGILFIRLPSGRRLAYVKPRIGVNRFGSDSVTYEGTGEQKKWIRLESFGGKFVENIVQATARDLLVEAMQRLSKKGYQIVMHIHDEVVLEVPDGVSSVEEACSIMAESPAWAGGLVLNADGFECDFYKKD